MMLRLPARPLALLLCCLLPGAARAAERAAVLVYQGAPPAPGRAAQVPPAPTAEAMARALRAALAERRVVVPEGAIAQGLRAHEDQRTQPLLIKLGAVRELMRTGQRRLAEVELEQAEAALAEAERRCDELLTLREGPALLAEVLRWRGVAVFELKRRAEAQRLFRRALVLQPAAVLTEADVRPEVALGFRRAAAELPAPVPLRVRPRLGALRTPAALLSAAAVLVDGAEVPMAGDWAEQAVAPGEHVVLLRAPGYLPAAQRVEVTDQGLEVEVALRPDPVEAAIGGLRRRPAAAGLEALCAALGLDDVLVAAPARDAGEEVLVGQRFRCREAAPGPLEALRAPAGAAPRALATELVGRLLRPGAAVAVAREPAVLEHPWLRSPRPPPRKVPLYARPWIWIGAAVVATGVLLGVALRPQPAPQTTLVVDPRGFALRF